MMRWGMVQWCVGLVISKEGLLIFGQQYIYVCMYPFSTVFCTSLIYMFTQHTLTRATKYTVYHGLRLLLLGSRHSTILSR